MILQLPLPMSPNRWPKTSPHRLQVVKDEYRLACWAAAVTQHKPHRDPPPLVTVHAMFLHRVTRGFRDETNMRAAMKWVEDALQQEQLGAMRWRQGLYTLCGYFINDSPDHYRLGDIWQQRCAGKKEECLVLEIVPGESPATTIAKAGRA